jgi:hypothetical protein
MDSFTEYKKDMDARIEAYRAEQNKAYRTPKKSLWEADMDTLKSLQEKGSQT